LRSLFADPRDETTLKLPAIYQKTERPDGLPGHSRISRRMGRPAVATQSEREGLKADLRGDLQSARTPASQEGIADANVSGGRQP